MTTQNRIVRLAPVAACAIMVATGLLIAGPLNPPAGPVASTHKTLTEIEPRIAINSTNTPGDAVTMFRITQPGSYYLTGNVQGLPGMSAIEILSGGVSIDLCGHALIGTGAGVGIRDTGILVDVNVCNGVIHSWGGPGIALGSSNGVRIKDVTVRNCTGGGIEVNNSATVLSCVAHPNGGSGIRAATGATITDCVSNQNTGDGINVGTGAVVTRCSAGSNGLAGIRVLASCVVSECSAYSNTLSGINVAAGGTRVTNCATFTNIQHGIISTNGGTIERCISRSNTLDGIRVASDCTVRDNVCGFNGLAAGNGAGIVVTGFDNLIEGNQCTGADRGIETTAGSGGSFIARNRCASNTTNWSITVGHACLVVSATTTAAFSGNSGGVAPGSTDPNANFSY